MSQHEAFYRRMHAALVAFLVEDSTAIQELQDRFKAHADSWSRAQCCAFYRSAHLYDAFRLGHADFYETPSDRLAGLLFPGIRLTESMQHDVAAVVQAHQAVLRFDSSDQALDVEGITTVASGTAHLLIAYPGFVHEADRERVLEQLAYEVAEDLLGPWPESQERSA
jgi:hypothetical protein